jgi:hypothetical protein
MAILVLLNNFMHDFSAAGWLFCTLLLWWILKQEGLIDSGPVVPGIIKLIINLMRISLGGIIVFGIIRALAYKQYEWSAAAGDSQVTLLIAKHILLTFVFILGVIYYRRAMKLVKS